MKLWRLLPLAVLWALTLLNLSGCATRPATLERTAPATVSICLNRNLRHGIGPWEREAATKFRAPVLIFCHGTTSGGRWMLTPDGSPAVPAEGVARLAKAIWPKRDVVLVSCNDDAHTLRTPGVHYANGSVWAIPGKSRRMYEGKWGWAVGRIEDFSEAK
jgi:hypothetical protein